jgi:cell division protein FtsB
MKRISTLVMALFVFVAMSVYAQGTKDVKKDTKQPVKTEAKKDTTKKACTDKKAEVKKDTTKKVTPAPKKK